MYLLCFLDNMNFFCYMPLGQRVHDISCDRSTLRNALMPQVGRDKPDAVFHARND